jgi:hypothetical protein
MLPLLHASADPGVAIDTGTIAVDEELTAGNTYALPSFGVRNPGNEETDYRIMVWPVADEAPAPDPAWVTFDPDRLTLRPGQNRLIEISLRLPIDAPAADYVALIGPEIVAEGGGAQVGAAAAARLTFTVKSPGAVEVWWLRLKCFFLDNLPWTVLAPVALIGALVALRSRRTGRLGTARSL